MGSRNTHAFERLMTMVNPVSSQEPSYHYIKENKQVELKVGLYVSYLKKKKKSSVLNLFLKIESQKW